MLSAKRRLEVLAALEAQKAWQAAHPGEPRLADWGMYNRDGSEYSVTKTVWIGRNCYTVETFTDGREPKVRRG